MQSDIEQTIAVTFQHLESVLQRALEVAPIKTATDLLAFLPQSSEAARRLTLAELIKLDMAKATQSDISRDLSFYAECLQLLFTDGHLPLDLVLEEIHQRRLRSETVSIGEYKARYPSLAHVLDDVLTRVASTASHAVLERPKLFEDGSQVDDFTILRSLGHGGFAIVYLARQNSMHRLVALKVSQRGSDEPIALSQLDHPNIVRVFDQRELTEPRMTLLYMQYIPGGTLADVVNESAITPTAELSGKVYLKCIDRSLLAANQQPPEYHPVRERIANMDWAELVAWLGTELAGGLSAAHRAGIMHRDVKPANILVSADGTPKLVDFNVSFSAVPGCAGAAVHFGGSLPYMSPEQLEIADPLGARTAEDLDQRSDVYSLAVVLWELWQGQRPFKPKQLMSSWPAAVTEQRRLSTLAPEVQRRFPSAAERVLENTLRAALAPDREHRSASAEELAGRLRLALLESAADLFEPVENGWRAKLRRWPVLWTSGLIIILPNALAGGLNFLYNHHSIAIRHRELEAGFVDLSKIVNLVAFPLGMLVLIHLAGHVQRGLNAAAARRPVQRNELDGAWNLGHHAALVGGLLWAIAGLIFPLVLYSWDQEFGVIDAMEFFISLAICGGIAWIYPFFGVSVLATEIYYPAMVKPTMSDRKFRELAETLKNRSNKFLISAAAIPLCALALLTLRQSSGDDAIIRLFLFIILLVTAAALAFAFLAHQRLLRTIADLEQVLE